MDEEEGKAGRSCWGYMVRRSQGERDREIGAQLLRVVHAMTMMIIIMVAIILIIIIIIILMIIIIIIL